MPCPPLFWLLLPLALGIVAGDSCRDVFAKKEILLFAVSGLSAGLACFVIGKRCVGNAIPALAGTFLCVLCVGMALLVTDRIREDVSWPEEVRTWRVVVTTSPRASARSLQFTGRVENGAARGRLVRWRVALPTPDAPAASGQPLLQPGDALLCRARITVPRNAGNPGEFDYAGWLRRQGVSGEAFCPSGAWAHRALPPSDLDWQLRALRFRDKLVARYAEYFSGRDLAVLSALTLGDKKHLDAGTRDIYSQSGVSHVLALSGLHLGILFSIYQFFILALCRRSRPLYVAAGLMGICFLWGFALLAGFPLSLVRAAVMFSIMQAATLFRRDSMSLSNLTLAATLILVVSPQALFDVGFQLSCLSVLSILLFVRRIPAPAFVTRWRMLRGVYGLLAVSFTAQMATAPLVAYYFHSFPVYGLLANLAAVPLAYLVLSVAVLFLALPFARSLLAFVLGRLLWLMDLALEWVTALPGAVCELHPTPSGVFSAYVAMGLAAMSLFRRHIGWLSAAVVVVVGGVGAEWYARRPERISPQIVFYNLPSSSVTPVHFIASSDRSYLWQSRPATAADSAGIDYVRHIFWQPQALSAPTAYTGDFSAAELVSRAGVTFFRHSRVAVAGGTLPAGCPAAPLAVDYLLIDRGCRTTLPALLSRFAPQRIVLSAALSDYYRQRYAAEAAACGLPVHDLRRDGALCTNID